MSWELMARPEGKNENKRNSGGLVILLKHSGHNDGGQEVGRVAFDRAESANPETDFDKQVDIEVAKAQKAIKTIEELCAGAGKLS